MRIETDGRLANEPSDESRGRHTCILGYALRGISGGWQSSASTADKRILSQKLNVKPVSHQQGSDKSKMKTEEGKIIRGICN